ncbi:hypothetical protein ABE288_25555 [Bacillus salipaludis]|uniref:hypothetical protein n=1 Tax=Bacillus salipaludis TaxID=2547811 RepID=UPI003D22120B
MSLKSALFEMQEALKEPRAIQSEEFFIKELETSNNLNPGTLIFFYNNLMASHMKHAKNNDNQTEADMKKVNRKWSKIEIEFMSEYIKERQEEGAQNITEILEEVAQLLNRGYQSVNYKYYSLLKTKGKIQERIHEPLHFTTISYNEVPVVSTEVIQENSPVSKETNHRDDDLLDVLSGLITNVQKLPGIQLNELLRSIYNLTNMALQNQAEVEQFENIKMEYNQENEILREKLTKKDQQLLKEKKRNDELQKEVSKLAKEITAFNQLGDAAKIQSLKAYNQRLNYIIDGFGIVMKVGS